MKNKIAGPALFVMAFALSRVLGVVSTDFANFSAAYALAFCAGVYFSKRMAWWFPFSVFLITDIALNFYWQAHGADPWSPSNLANQSFNYIAYAVLIFLGRRFKPKASFGALLGGGILGSILFYFITNTASWFFNPFHNPEYTKTLLGWWIALTKGTGGWPETWQFFRNTLLSGGLFTALFVAAAKLTAESPAEKVAGVKETEEEPEAEPDTAEA